MQLKKLLRVLTILFVLTIIILISLYIQMKELSGHVYNYGSLNTDFTYTCMPPKRNKLEQMLWAKEKYDALHYTDTRICRKFPKNYLMTWRWRKYWTNPYYDFPCCKD